VKLSTSDEDAAEAMAINPAVSMRLRRPLLSSLVAGSADGERLAFSGE
jgi:hypothetical protein